ncbi:hypothetical protein N657DRAFT_443914 [Parathielavia appendiculata]|uniref:Uncharacterized protein n=1 Tax=Parathielavia appendiculata TaxID=2587402 RepID=A0AAN6U0A5_9PEZI|nr:hypothetical protein N657DRAFT_443914 [Parathielavia appendiculata]
MVVGYARGLAMVSWCLVVKSDAVGWVARSWTELSRRGRFQQTSSKSQALLAFMMSLLSPISTISGAPRATASLGTSPVPSRQMLRLQRRNDPEMDATSISFAMPSRNYRDVNMPRQWWRRAVCACIAGPVGPEAEILGGKRGDLRRSKLWDGSTMNMHLHCRQVDLFLRHCSVTRVDGEMRNDHPLVVDIAQSQRGHVHRFMHSTVMGKCTRRL